MDTESNGPAAVLTSVEDRLKRVRTRSQDLSFNELLSMYKDNELVIRPEYQRLFRWDSGKQSRFIESLVLELPVPPVFVIEDETSRYELIDGLQRISSYLHFRGALRGHADIPDGELLTLVDCDIVPELNGLTSATLPASLDIKLKRHFTRVEVVRKESDPELRYHMFKRLNTGGELLSDQELRNCTIRLLGSDFIDFLTTLSGFDAFQRTIERISDERRQSMYDKELVLRFLALKNWRSEYTHEIGDFLTSYMEHVTKKEVSFDYASEKQIFEGTFSILADALGVNTFERTNDKGTFVQGFSPVHFEAITLGVQPFLAHLGTQPPTRLRDALVQLKNNRSFRDATTGGGKNFAKLLTQRVELVKQAVSKA